MIDITTKEMQMKFTQVKSFFIAVMALFAVTQANAEERVVATVDGYPIMMSQVQKVLGKKANTEANRKAAIDKIVEDFIVQRAIQESGVKVDYAYVDQMIENIAIQNGITYGQLLDALDYQGITLEQYRAQLAQQILMDQVRQQVIGKSVKVEQQDVQALAKKMMDSAKASGKLKTASGTEHRVSHILVKTNPVFSDDKAKAKLVSITSDITSGKITFEEAAKMNSADYASAIVGGDLGWNFLDVYDAKFAEMAKKGKLGIISAPFKSQFGWHIVKVTETRKGDKTQEVYLQKAYDQLVNQQVKAAEKDWIKALKQRAEIKYVN